MRRRGRMCRGEYAWKTARIHTSLWKTNHLHLLTILDEGDTRSPTRRGKDADGPLRPLPGAPQKKRGCLEPRSSLLGAPGRVNGPLSRDFGSFVWRPFPPGPASWQRGGISGTMARRWPPAQTCRGRARIAKTWPRWRRSQGSPCLCPRCGLSAFFPSNSVVSPPPKQRRLVALHSWVFLRAIGPAVATRPPA